LSAQDQICGKRKILCGLYYKNQSIITDQKSGAQFIHLNTKNELLIFDWAYFPLEHVSKLKHDTQI